MKKMINRFILPVLLGGCVSAFGYSNPIEGGSTDTVTNLWNVPLPWLIVGGNSDSNSLVITDGGEVNNAIGYIGNAVTSTHNSALVTGAGSQWNNSMELSVGYLGASNAMIVADGGTVTTPNAYIGNNSDGNAVIVTGNNSLLDTANLNVGYQGSSNSLLITDGGTAESEAGTIGYWINSDGNTATVQSNGIWNSSTAVNVGEYGSGNQLTVGAGGLVDSPVVNVGVHSIASNNTVTVTGNGAWLDAPELYIGGSADGIGGTRNRVEVENGGTIYTESLNIYSNNAFDLSNGGRLFVNTNFNASMTNFNFNAGGTLEVGGELTGMTNSIEGQRTLVLNGSSAQWDRSSSDIKIGEFTGSNALSIVNGGYLETAEAFIGYASGADSNTVLVSGTNTVWDNSSNLYIGYQGSGNSLVVTDGGEVNTSFARVGAIGSNSNSLVVANGGSFLSTGNLSIGGFYPPNLLSTDNSLVITNGGNVQSGGGGIAHSSSALVSGTGSTWFIGDALSISHESNLTVNEGGTVSAARFYLGSRDAAPHLQGDQLIVSGQGSRLEIRENDSPNDFQIDGIGSLVRMEDGGQILVDGASKIDGADHSVIVTGSNSLWNSRVLGVDGSQNAVVIEDGGALVSTDSHIGDLSGTSNSVLVTGDSSIWHNTGFLLIGNAGSYNSLTIEDGGFVANGDSTFDYQSGSTIGYQFGSDYNSVLVTGEDSLWQSYNNLHLGGRYEAVLTESGFVIKWTNGGYGNSLTVEDGGRVLVGNVDTNALAGIGGGIIVGDATGAEMVVANASSVHTVNSWIGLGTAEQGTVEVRGSGSIWTNSGDVYIGYGGSYNTLNITNGGTVYNENAYIGNYEMASGNSATVSGNWSTWANDGELHVGYNGSDNSLRVGDKGHVYAWDGMTIGHGASATSNQVTVSGNGSFLNVGAPLMVARWLPLTNYPPIPVGEGNGLTTTDGGLVMVLLNFGGTNLPVFGEGGSLRVENNFLINANGLPPLFTDSGNNLTINNGFVAATPADLSSDSGIMLDTESALESSTGLTAGDEAVLEVSTNLIVGSVGSSNTVVIIPGTFPPFPLLSVDDLYGQLVVGHGGSYNSLDIEAGGLTASGTGIIGATSNAWFNSVSVSGDNSRWILFGNLYIGGRLESGTWSDGGLGNALYVADGGLVDVAHNLHNRNYSMLNLDPGGLVSIGGDYYQDDTALLRFGVETNAAGAPVNALMTVGGTAEFEEGAQIEYASNVGELLFDRFYTNKLIEADALVVAGISNPDSLDLELLDASGSLVDVIFWENDQDIYALAGRRYLADSAGFDEDSMMGRLAKEIDDMSLLGRTGAMEMIDLLNTMTGSEQNEELVQEYAYSTPNYLHIQGMTEGLGELTKHTSRRPAAAPEGASGPYRADQGARGWIRPYGSWSERTAHDGFAGYDHNVYGTLVGMDWIQSNVLLGIAGGYARSNIKQDDGDASEARTGYGVFYASLGTKDWFGDINFAVGRSDVEDESGTGFSTQADYKASNFALYLGGGKEIRSRSGIFSFTPKASLLLSDYHQNAYTEEIEPGMVREVAPYEHSSILSSLGATVAMQKEYDGVILRPEARLRWLHEFNSDVEQVDFVFSEGLGGEYYSLMPASEEDVLEVGAGLTCALRDALSLALDLDWRIGEDYDAYSVSGRAVVEF